MFKPNKKLASLPPYLFARIKVLKDEMRAKGVDVIDLDMGNPDQPTPDFVIDRFVDTVKNHHNTHRYPQAKGMPRLRKAISEWYAKKYGVKIDSKNEALVLIGSKEGVCHLSMTFLEPGDYALIPDPTYPVHFNGAYLAGGKVYYMPLLEKNNYLPDLKAIPQKVLKKSKIIVFSYPNNPTSASLPDNSFFKKIIALAKKYKLIAVHDFAYADVVFDGYKAPSFLATPGAKEVGVEFCSFSKTYNMAGWRLGYVAGNKEIVGQLEKFKSFLDYGVFTAVQLAGVAALEEGDKSIQKMQKVYQKRRDYMVENLNKIGWYVQKPKGTMYLWVKLPAKFQKMGSLKFSEYLLRKTGVSVSPGVGFGPSGEGYIRMALVTNDERYSHVIKRLKEISF